MAVPEIVVSVWVLAKKGPNSFISFSSMDDKVGH
jgi:hypothetical protein